MSDSFTSSSYYYSSTTNGSDGKTTTGHRYSTTSYTEPDGTTIVRTAQQDLGQPAVVEERRYDNTGQEQQALPEPAGGTSAGGIRRIIDLEDDVSDSKITHPKIPKVPRPMSLLILVVRRLNSWMGLAKMIRLIWLLRRWGLGFMTP
ncbi:hypothetical protein N7472_000724 [Penicillium cf. griseofulvum]|uniref:Uncharacterized protein n=1 Tax=Penicillium cf. griseofulvum TaxID=2972120 RepID=A0A9W9N055_9EURO|nr:hypothetical protein N7472_000724 [Penicillium cf. griseofulvum]